MGLNTATIIGNLGADPECRKMNDGTSVANMRIAVTDKWTDKQSGQKRERTEWISAVLFGPSADIAERYLSKGSQCGVVGRIATRKWQDRDGNDRYSTEVVVDRMGRLILLGGRSDDRRSNDPAGQDPNFSFDDRQRDPARQAPGGGGETGYHNDLDSEIPFITPWGAY